MADIPWSTSFVAADSVEVNAQFPWRDLPHGTKPEEVAKEYVLFSVGIMEMYGLPVNRFMFDFLASTPDCPPMIRLVLPEPVFSGFELRDFSLKALDHLLYGVVKDKWPVFREFLLSIVFNDHILKTTTSVGMTSFLRGNINNPVGVFPVRAFGLSGTKAQIALVEGNLVFLPPDSSIFQITQALERGDNPLLKDNI